MGKLDVYVNVNYGPSKEGGEACLEAHIFTAILCSLEYL